MQMTVCMTFFLLSKVPQYNAYMLYIGQMLCIPAFPHTAVRLMHSVTTSPIQLLPFKPNISHLLGQTGLVWCHVTIIMHI